MFGLDPRLHAVLCESGYERPLPVQVACAAPILDGRHLVVRARTGSGKTLAYVGTTFTRGTRKTVAVHTAIETAEKGRQEKKAKAAKPKGDLSACDAQAARKLGCLDAAIGIPKGAGGGSLGCKEAVEWMLAKGLWHTEGATPASTLCAAILREVANPARGSRFRKTGRGEFELSEAARK